MEQKRNQAFRRTDKIIEEAFAELCREKGFDKVTVKDIITKAMISKNTFYQHYRDKYELADMINRRYADRILENVQSAYFKEGKNLFDYPKEERSGLLQERMSNDSGNSGDLKAHMPQIRADGKDLSSFIKDAYYDKYMESAHCADLSGGEKEVEAAIYAAVKESLFQAGNQEKYKSLVFENSDRLTIYAMLYAIGIKSKDSRQRITESLLNEREKAMKQQ